MALDLETFLLLISPADGMRLDVALGTTTADDQRARFNALAAVADGILLGHLAAAGYAIPLVFGGVAAQITAANAIIRSLSKDLILLEIAASLDRTPDWAEAAKTRADIRVQQLVGTATPTGGREAPVLVLPGVTR